MPMTPASTVQVPARPRWENTASSWVRVNDPARTTAFSSDRMGASMATRFVARSETVTSPSWPTTR